MKGVVGWYRPLDPVLRVLYDSHLRFIGEDMNWLYEECEIISELNQTERFKQLEDHFKAIAPPGSVLVLAKYGTCLVLKVSRQR